MDFRVDVTLTLWQSKLPNSWLFNSSDFWICKG